MNFLKSTFFSDLKLPETATPQERETLEGPGDEGGVSEDSSHLKTAAASSSRAWGFGDFVKSLSLKSEEMLQTYRKDLHEFGAGLKEEGKIIAAVATHAAELLPSSIETGASVAQDSLESVTEVLEEFSNSVWRGTADIIAQGQEAVFKDEEDDISASSTSKYGDTPVFPGKYSRFEAQVRAMQYDSRTYCDEPEDQEDYEVWKSSFDLTRHVPDIESIFSGNSMIQETFSRLVPQVVPEGVFWERYVYRLHKIRQTEEARVHLVKRAVAMDDEDLTWDTDEEGDSEVPGGNGEAGKEGETVEFITERNGDNSPIINTKKHPVEGKLEDASTMAMVEPQTERMLEDIATQNPQIEGKLENMAKQKSQIEGRLEGAITVSRSMQKTDEKPVASTDEAVGREIGCKKNDIQASVNEEDYLGWEIAEEVEDSSGNGGKKSATTGASWAVPPIPREDIKRKLAVQIDSQDLSWDDGDAMC